MVGSKRIRILVLLSILLFIIGFFTLKDQLAGEVPLLYDLDHLAKFPGADEDFERWRAKQFKDKSKDPEMEGKVEIKEQNKQGSNDKQTTDNTESGQSVADEESKGKKEAEDSKVNKEEKASTGDKEEKVSQGKATDGSKKGSKNSKSESDSIDNYTGPKAPSKPHTYKVDQPNDKPPTPKVQKESPPVKGSEGGPGQPNDPEFNVDEAMDNLKQGKPKDNKPESKMDVPVIKPNDIPKPKTAEEPEDVKNPGKFLGTIEEVDESERAASIYEDKDDEELFKNFEQTTIGEIEHDDSEFNFRNLGEKIGIPDPKKFPEKVTKAPKDFVKVKDDFSTPISPMNFRIYSHNVKNGGHDDLVPGEERWEDRYMKIANSIKFNSHYNTIVTLQEVYKFQMLDLMNELNKFSSEKSPEWSYYGEGRIDGKDIGEFVPILYKNSEWELIQSDTIWLNKENERQSLEGWDAKYLRILSYVTLRHRDTNNYVNIFNTHLDHIGKGSRIGSARLILDKIKKINNWPSFLTGDLNLEKSEKTFLILSKSMVNARDHTTPFNVYGHTQSTVTGFEGEVIASGGQNIDYIFAPLYTSKITSQIDCSKVDKTKKRPQDMLYLRLDGFGMLHSKFDGVYMSDHRPLVADFHLEGKCQNSV
ncbi:hypothetical protein CLIB1444_07S04830 [[Candida] jaroonii]|uniref:Uncharacterized protein n=1 Tax=[Candida] jaroonii TaxID=467808 RepID=A0ACA9YAP1_9ASCO|nr:hypothetical protein CLIB1444_07S04830 [[Candida] jaroonii]